MNKNNVKELLLAVCKEHEIKVIYTQLKTEYLIFHERRKTIILDDDVNEIHIQLLIDHITSK